MENPFFRNFYNTNRHRYSPSSKSVPIQQQQQSSPSPSPKIVPIPVHFVTSETRVAESEKRQSAAAVKIQKVSRGFIIRKIVKKIVEIRSEAVEIERRILNAKDLIRSDAKERLKVNEMLMSLLFRLDSIRGVDAGVRDCRKAVIRKVIALQEAVDAIVAATDEEKNVQVTEMVDSIDFSSNPEPATNSIDQNADTNKSINQTLEKQDRDILTERFASDEPVETGVDLSKNPIESAENCGNLCSGVYQIIEKPDLGECLEKSKSISEDGEKNFEERMVNAIEESWKNTVESVENCLSPKEDNRILESEDVKDIGVDEISNTVEETLQKHEQKIREEYIKLVENCPSSIEEEKQRSEAKDLVDYQVVGEIKQDQDGKSCDVNGGVMLSMMERLMEENDKLKDLMAEIYQQSAMQNRLISSLSQRVEQLERVARSERMRQRKKKRQARTAERSETPTNARKCGWKL